MIKPLMVAISMACIVILNGQPTKYHDMEEIFSDSKSGYFFNKAALTWTQADAACKKHGMRLVTVMNGAQNAFIHREIRKRKMNYAWIGFNDRAKEGHFVWNYACPKYRNFNKGEPNGKRSENCVMMYSSMGRWNDLNCNSKQPSVCHKATGGRCGSNSGGGPAGYAFIKGKFTYAQAEAACKKRGMRLVTISNKGQNALVHKEIRRRKMGYSWIGLNDRAKEGSFVWLYGCPKYRNFNKGEPNGKRKENCVHMYPSHGRWNDLSCNSKQSAVCHKATGGKCGHAKTHKKTVTKTGGSSHKTVTHGGSSSAVHHQVVTHEVTYEKVYYKKVPADEKKADAAKA